MAVEEEVLSIVRRKIGAWKDGKVNTARAMELRQEIFSKTGKYKFAPLVNIKKWIRQAGKTLASEGGLMAKKTKKTKTKARERRAPEEQRLPPSLSDRVFLQNIGFEIAGMRRALERLSQQLDLLERQIALKKSHAESD